MMTYIVIDYKTCIRTITYIEYLESKTFGDDISFVIVDNSLDNDNWNTFIEEFNLEGDVIVVGEIYYTKPNNRNLVLVKNYKNGGYSNGNNLGFSFAKRFFKPDIVCFSNNDILCQSECIDISHIYNIYAKYDEVAVVGPEIKGVDGVRQSPSKMCTLKDKWTLPCFCYPFSRIFGISQDDVLHHQGEGKVEKVMGAFFFIKSDVFDAINGFDENVFLYGEEDILSRKIKKKGYATYYYPNIHMIHEQGKTTTKYFDDIRIKRMQFVSALYIHRNYDNEKAINIILARIAFSIFALKYIILCRIDIRK